MIFPTVLSFLAGAITLAACDAFAGVVDSSPRDHFNLQIRSPVKAGTYLGVPNDGRVENPLAQHNFDTHPDSPLEPKPANPPEAHHGWVEIPTHGNTVGVKAPPPVMDSRKSTGVSHAPAKLNTRDNDGRERRPNIMAQSADKSASNDIKRGLPEGEIPHLAARDPNFQAFVQGVGGSLADMMKRAEIPEMQADTTPHFGTHGDVSHLLVPAPDHDMGPSGIQKQQASSQKPVKVTERRVEHKIFHQDEQANGQPIHQFSGGPPPFQPKPVIPASNIQNVIHREDEAQPGKYVNQFSGPSKPFPPPQIPPPFGNPPSYRQATQQRFRRRAIEAMLNRPPPHLRALQQKHRRSTTTISGSNGESSVGSSVAGSPGRDSSSQGASVTNEFYMSSNPSRDSGSINRVTHVSGNSGSTSSNPDPYKHRYLQLLQQMNLMQQRQQLRGQQEKKQGQHPKHNDQSNAFSSSPQSDGGTHQGQNKHAYSRYGAMAIPSEPHEMIRFSAE